jgi:hypothetical protein
MNQSFLKKIEEKKVRINPRKQPAGRDGHSAIKWQNKFWIIFGGDRHHMPYNDLYLLNLGAL